MPDDQWEARIENLEAQLARFVRSYIDASSQGDAPEVQENYLRSICSTFARLLQQRLEGCDGWKPSYWIDGVRPAADMLPDSAHTLSPGDLSVRGSAIWSKGGSGDPFWIESFFGTVRIAATGDAPVGHTICFGDATRGLATVAYGTHLRRVDWFYPEEWLFTFTKGNGER